MMEAIVRSFGMAENESSRAQARRLALCCGHTNSTEFAPHFLMQRNTDT